MCRTIFLKVVRPSLVSCLPTSPLFWVRAAAGNVADDRWMQTLEGLTRLASWCSLAELVVVLVVDLRNCSRDSSSIVRQSF